MPWRRAAAFRAHRRCAVGCRCTTLRTCARLASGTRPAHILPHATWLTLLSWFSVHTTTCLTPASGVQARRALPLLLWRAAGRRPQQPAVQICCSLSCRQKYTCTHTCGSTMPPRLFPPQICAADAILIFDEAHNIEDQARWAGGDAELHSKHSFKPTPTYTQRRMCMCVRPHYNLYHNPCASYAGKLAQLRWTSTCCGGRCRD